MPEILSKLGPNDRFWLVIKFALVISLVESISQVNIKQKNVLIGLIGYTIIVFILYNSYNYEGLGHMNLVWSCVSILMCYFMGYLFFNESINVYTIGAMIFSICAIYLAHRSDEAAIC